MASLTDARNNELTGALLDQIGNNSVTDARTSGATLTGVGQVFLDLNGKGSAAFDVRVAANATATLIFEGTVDGSNYYVVPALVVATATPGGSPLAIANESYVSSIVLATNTLLATFIVDCGGWRQVRCRVSAYTSGSISIVARASAGETVYYQRQLSLLDTAQGVINQSSSQLFIDTFDASFDTTNNWNTAVTGSAGVAFVFSTASITGGTGTTANGFSVVTTRQSFQPGNPGYLEIQMNMGMPDNAAPVANSFLAWGIMSPQAVPTTANPISNGLVFERATNGKMFVAVYQSGTRTVIQDLSVSTGNGTQPTGTGGIKYYMWIRGDVGFFAIKDRNNIVAQFTTGALGPDITTLPVACMCVGGPTPPVSNVQLVNNMTCVGDTANSTLTLSDPQFPFRQANVKAASTAVAATDLALVVGISPNSPAFLRASDLCITATSTAATLTLTLPAVAGQFHYITAIDITHVATTAVAGTATVAITTTNLPGSMAWTTGNAAPAGTLVQDLQMVFTSPLKSSVANTNTVITEAAHGATVVQRGTVHYYTAP